MNAIYSVAYQNALGDAAWHQAFDMVKSLREEGQFDGDILIFAPHKAEVPGATVVTDTLPVAFYNPKLAKPWFGMTHDFSRYEKVMLLDTDIIALRPVAPLFAQGGICSPADYDKWGTIGLHCLPELPIKRGEKGFNSGTIVAEAHQWPVFARMWWDKLLEVRSERIDEQFRWVDQPIFNHLHWAGYITVNHLPKDSVFLFHQDQKIGPETILAHCTQLTALGVMKALREARHDAAGHI